MVGTRCVVSVLFEEGGGGGWCGAWFVFLECAEMLRTSSAHRIVERGAARPYRLICRTRRSTSLPTDCVDAASPGPIVGVLHQTGAHGIVHHVNALVLILALSPQPMVKQPALPATGWGEGYFRRRSSPPASSARPRSASTKPPHNPKKPSRLPEKPSRFLQKHLGS